MLESVKDSKEFDAISKVKLKKSPTNQQIEKTNRNKKKMRKIFQNALLIDVGTLEQPISPDNIWYITRHSEVVES